MTANFTEPSFIGSFRSCAGTETVNPMSTSIDTSKRRISPPALLSYVRNEVDDDVRLHVAQDQVLVDDAVLELFGELRKAHQDVGRGRRQRVAFRVRRIDLVGDLLRLTFV